MAFTSVKGLLEGYAAQMDKEFWEYILEEDMHAQQITREQSLAYMRRVWQVMRQTVAHYDAAQRSRSGLSGGDGEKMRRAEAAGHTLTNGFVTEAMRIALVPAECNACMKRIVAAPTAGSCGVLPAVLLAYENAFGAEPQAFLEALYVAAAYGEIITAGASISGAQGGCQAEVGTASAMAAAALVYLHGGSPEEGAQACAIALKNMLGLTCDPVAGLVEVPCVKRNAAGAMNAIAAAEMALAGIESRIPPDEVIGAMDEVSQLMSSKLRETGEGGLAATPTARQIQHRLREMSGQEQR